MRRAHRKAHAAIWSLLAILLPICLAIAVGSISTLSRDAPSVRLDPVSREEDP